MRLAVEAVTPLAAVTQALRSVQSDAADLAVATTFGAEALGIDRETLELRHFARVRVVPVACAGHPLAGAGAPVPTALREHAQIVLRDSTLGESSASLNVLTGGLRWTVTDVAAKKELIAAGMGWGGLPEHVVAAELASGALVALDVPEFEAESMELFVMRRRDRARGVVMQALWRALTSG